VTKIEIDWVRNADIDAFLSTIETNRQAAIDFAEKRLRRNPNQADLLRNYVGLSNENDRGRIESFLKTGLDRRPVDIMWHRAYQTIPLLNHHEADLVRLYDGFLAADPSNASLLYLRGRIDPDWRQQETLFRRAMVIDPKLGWPWLGIAALATAEARWDDSLHAALEARRLGVNEPDRIAEIVHESKMARGEAKFMVDQYRAATNANPHDAATLFYLIDALAASGQESEIDPAINTWIMRLPGVVQGQIAPHLKASGLYYAGKLEDCAKLCGSNALLKTSPTHFHCLLALGRMKEATNPQTFGNLLEAPWNMLAISIGFQLAGKPEDSAKWRAKAASASDKVAGIPNFTKAAQRLTDAAPSSVEDVYHIDYVSPAEKAILFTALAHQFPAKRNAYLVEASKFNVSHKPAYQLIRQATAPKPSSKP
jgi:hypothetical protein